VKVVRGPGAAGPHFRAENWILPALLRFRRDEAATTAIECGLIAVGVSVVIVAAVNAIGANFGIGTLAASAGTRTPANSGPDQAARAGSNR